ncbi:MAG: hypothetical protein GEU98_20320 [Pseudonocardiaceae bacterium]|nr:hypothetical protein [Pseudonocardiaceae bacterium]
MRVFSLLGGRRFPVRVGVLVALGAAAVLLGACGEKAGLSPAPPSTSSAPGETTSSAAPGTTSSPPPSSEPKSTTPAGCGTVEAASGKLLEVLPPRDGPDCAEASRIVAAFQKQLGGQQDANSNQPAGGQVEGWMCVSGPPTSNGGTTCTQRSGDARIFARVLAGSQ